MSLIEPAVEYRPTHKNVQAIVIPDYTKFLDDPEKCTQFIEELEDFANSNSPHYNYVVNKRRYGDEYYFAIEENITFIQLKPGNYLLKDSHGKVSSLKPEEFSKLYIKLE